MAVKPQGWCEMPEIKRPDGATIHYEVSGSGYPLLLIAPGGVSSQVGIWARSAINPIERFASDFTVVAMDQRHAGRSLAPMRPFSYDVCNADQLAVLDELGFERAHVMGGCIGCAHILRLVTNAPGRITAGVCQDPVGLDATNSPETFYAMFHETMRLARADGVEAVVSAAQANPLFMMNNGAGPFAPLLNASQEARDELIAMGRERYIALIVEFRDGIWPDNPPYMSVPQDAVRSCQTPLLVLPGRDQFHPTGVGRAPLPRSAERPLPPRRLPRPGEPRSHHRKCAGVPQGAHAGGLGSAFALIGSPFTTENTESADNLPGEALWASRVLRGLTLERARCVEALAATRGCSRARPRPSTAGRRRASRVDPGTTCPVRAWPRWLRRPLCFRTQPKG